MQEYYYVKFAVAAIRGYLERTGKRYLVKPEYLQKSIDELSDCECEEIIDVARKNEIKIYHFKKSDSTLPRVHKVIGFLKGVYFENLLDVGSGRGVFLLPLIDNFPYLNVTSVDILDKRIDMLSDIKNGGIQNLNVVKADICTQPFSDKSFDIVTMLEVLEHIPDVKSAIEAAVKMAKKHIVVTVPSKEDDNPEHIHLLTKAKLTEYFNAYGVTKLRFDGVQGHLLMIATIEGE